MRAFGFELTDIEIIELMKEYDKDGNDNLDLAEFIDLMNKNYKFSISIIHPYQVI